MPKNQLCSAVDPRCRRHVQECQERHHRGALRQARRLEAHLSSEKAPQKAKAKGAARWNKTVADDEQWLTKKMAAGVKDEGNAGFMDFQKELIIALRDASGLRWGGSDLGGDNGDLMHFDGGTMELAKRLRNKTREVRTKAASAPSSSAAPAPS